MEEIKDDVEIVEKLSILHNKYELTMIGVVNSSITPNEAQRIRLIEQLDSITAQTNRFIKNLLLLLGEEV